MPTTPCNTKRAQAPAFHARRILSRPVKFAAAESEGARSSHAVGHTARFDASSCLERESWALGLSPGKGSCATGTVLAGATSGLPRVLEEAALGNLGGVLETKGSGRVAAAGDEEVGPRPSKGDRGVGRQCTGKGLEMV